MLTGGGVRAGQLIGGTDDKGHGPDDATQIKPDDLAATLCHALGIDHAKEYQTRTGRPVLSGAARNRHPGANGLTQMKSGSS